MKFSPNPVKNLLNGKQGQNGVVDEIRFERDELWMMQQPQFF